MILFPVTVKMNAIFILMKKEEKKQAIVNTNFYFRL